MILSPTQIESYDPTTPFGCKRKWWYERIGGRSKGVISGGELGSAVHTTLEDFLRGGPQGGLHDLVIGAPGALEWLIKLRPRILRIEEKINEGDLKLAGVPTIGRIDWVASSEVGYELGDHKTTSVIAKYAKTSGEIKKSTQMNVYAKWLVDQSMGDVDEMIITQDYYQTKGAKKFDAVSCRTSKPEIESRILEIENTVEEMVKASKVTSPEEIEPNLKVCNIAFGCPHRSYCPRSGEFNMASLLDMFAGTPAAPAPVVNAIIAESKPTPSMALPPDVPKSDPTLAADKVEEPRPELVLEPALPDTPPAKGRAKGSKNKPKEFATPEEIAQMQAAAVSVNVKSSGPVTIHKISIRHGAKIGMPNFSSATVEVEMEGLVNGSVEEAKESLSTQVRAQMRKELEVYTKAPATEAK